MYYGKTNSPNLMKFCTWSTHFNCFRILMIYSLRMHFWILLIGKKQGYVGFSRKKMIIGTSQMSLTAARALATQDS